MSSCFKKLGRCVDGLAKCDMILRDCRDGFKKVVDDPEDLQFNLWKQGSGDRAAGDTENM